MKIYYSCIYDDKITKIRSRVKFLKKTFSGTFNVVN